MQSKKMIYIFPFLYNKCSKHGLLKNFSTLQVLNSHMWPVSVLFDTAFPATDHSQFKILHCFFLSFSIDFFLKGSLIFPEKLKRRYRDFPYITCPTLSTAYISEVCLLLAMNLQWPLPSYHHHHPKSRVCIRVHACCCTFHVLSHSSHVWLFAASWL